VVERGAISTCPVCGRNARVIRRWTLNKYGKRYNYLIFKHEKGSHYVNQDRNVGKRIRKGQLEKALMEMINSQEFRLGSFKVKDIMDLMKERYTNIGYCSVKTNLNKLAQIGMVECRKEGRNLYYVSTVSKERLSFMDNSCVISLEDVLGDGMFRKHIFVYSIKNHQSWPLYYMPFRIAGDTECTYEEVNFKATDPATGSSYDAIIIEDNPTDKRLLIKLKTPLLPTESTDIKLEYQWDEPARTYVYSSATKMNYFEFSIATNREVKLSSSLTPPNGNLTIDLSNEITHESNEKWKHIWRLVMRDIEAFSVFQFKW